MPFENDCKNSVRAYTLNSFLDKHYRSLDSEYSRDDLVQHLNNKGVATRLLFGGNIIRQPYMKGRNYRISGSLENADLVTTNTFWIGLFPGLGEDHLSYATETIAKFIAGSRLAA